MEQTEVTRSIKQQTFDVAIIGGGLVGCAMARRFTLEGARVLLLERGSDILSGASKGNSAILHTGFDAPPESIELQCVQNGYQEYMAIRESMNLPVLKTGAHVVAWTENDLAQFPKILAKAHQNGITNAVEIGQPELLSREPGLAKHAKGAIWVPDEFLIDPWSAPLAYLQQAVDNGANLLLNCEVTDGEFDGQTWQLNTSKGQLKATSVVNCAGLRGDWLEKNLLGHSDFEIRPRKGQFVVFDKAAHHLIDSIILPVPNEITKGIVLTRTIFGNLLVGPTAEEQPDRDHAELDAKTLETLRQAAIEHIPALANIPVTATYAGLRPGSDEKEYRIHEHWDKHYITVGGIRSTGLTAALGIAQYIYQKYRTHFSHQPIAQPSTPHMPILAEHLKRDWQTPGYEEMVCHCELVTKREIEATFNTSVPPGDFGGLRRRTRACMGRCQGFYCSSRVAELAGDKLRIPLTVEEHNHD